MRNRQNNELGESGEITVYVRRRKEGIASSLTQEPSAFQMRREVRVPQPFTRRRPSFRYSVAFAGFAAMY